MTPEEEQRQQQFHDINRPGRHSPSPTSRPIIVGHHPTMPDPMVNQRPMHHPQPPQPSRPLHQPPHQSMPLDGFSHPTGHRPAPLNQAQPSTHQPHDSLESPPIVSSPHHLPPQSLHHHDYNSEPLTGQPLHNYEVESGISRNRVKWWAPLVALLVILIVLYLLIDADVIHSGINLPFHVFHQESPPVYTPPTPYFQ